MKYLDVQEFGGHAAQYFLGDEEVAIQQDGETIGYYKPVDPLARKLPNPPTAEAKAKAMEELEKISQKLMESTGFTEDELARFFDLSQPPTEDLLAKLSEQNASSDVSVRAPRS